MNVESGIVRLGAEVKFAEDAVALYAYLRVRPADNKTYDCKGICLAPTINKLSLYKPTWTQQPGLTASGLPAYNPNVADANAVGYGITVPILPLPTAYSSFVAKYWTHRAPDASLPSSDGWNYGCFRHFEGYYHNAMGVNPLDVTCEAGKPILVSLHSGALDSATVNIANISKSAKDYHGKRFYLGVAYYKRGTLAGSPASVTACRASYPVIQDNGSLPTSEVLNLGNAEENCTYVFVPCLTNADRSLIWSASVNAAFSGIVSKTTGEAKNVIITDAYITSQAAGYFVLRVVLKNEASEARIISDQKMNYQIIQPSGGAGLNGTATISGNVSIAAGETKTLTHTIYISGVTTSSQIYGEYQCNAGGKTITSPWIGGPVGGPTPDPGPEPDPMPDPT